jgi:hypothetical protein
VAVVTPVNTEAEEPGTTATAATELTAAVHPEIVSFRETKMKRAGMPGISVKSLLPL